MDTATTTVYVLQCEHGMYYVGKTGNLTKRIEQHFGGDGAEWTRQHRPQSVVESFNGDQWDEDKTVKRYMSQYGIDKVRGGSYVTQILGEDVKKLLEKELRSAQDRCFKCGQQGHLVKDCGVEQCQRCGMANHRTENCRARCIRCGRWGHWIEDCKIEPFQATMCTRCGRNNHTVDQCYAKTTLEGLVVVDKVETKTSKTEPKSLLDKFTGWLDSLLDSI